MLYGDYGNSLREGWFVAFLATIMLTIVVVTTVSGMAVTRHNAKRRCNNYATATHRTTEFHNYTFWSWDCMTPTPGDEQHLIPIQNLAGTSQ